MKPTRDEVLKWAREAGYPVEAVTLYDPRAAVFASIAYAAGARDMQERCAKECETEAAVAVVNAPADYQAGREMGATVCAAAIRALGDDDE